MTEIDYIQEDFSGSDYLLNQIPTNYYEVGDQLFIVVEECDLIYLNQFLQDNNFKVVSYKKIHNKSMLFEMKLLEKVIHQRKRV